MDAIERPNDRLYEERKHELDEILSRVAARKKALVDVIKSDVINDLALSEAIDESGILIEYLIQENGADRPFFGGKQIMEDFSRVSKLKTVYAFAKVLELEESALHQVLMAEVERLWFDPKRASARESSKQDKTSTQLELPQEVVGLLRSISKTVNRKKE